jgi:hypothetical protein
VETVRGPKFARHVVKFGDGRYLGVDLTHEGRVECQSNAQRWLTWASAKVIADSARYAGHGARAVRLVPVAWCARTLAGDLVLMGTTRAMAKELWRPEHNRELGTRLVKYVPAKLNRKKVG